MDQDCVVFGCRNSSILFQSKRNDCNFFNFPLNKPDLQIKWLKKLNLEKWTPGPENVICEEHFSLESFEIVDNKRTLKSDAVPSMIDDWSRIITNNEAILNTLDENSEDCQLSKDIRCRICANFLAPSNAVDISSKDDNVMEKMMACIPILVKSADFLPKHICRLCLTDLNISYRMLVRAIESEKLFNSLLKQSQTKVLQNDEEIIEKLDDVEKTSDCVICNVHFDNADDLNSHFQEKHVDEMDFVDQDDVEKSTERIDCGEYEDDLLTIVDVKDIANRNTRSECIIELEYDAELDENEDTNQNANSLKTKWKCNLCSMSFVSKDILNFHTMNFHKAEVDLVNDAADNGDQNYSEDGQYSVCQFCMDVFCTADELNEHLKSHMESLVCDVCNCLCQDFEQLQKHRATHAKRTNKNNTCPICYTVFLTQSEMTQHSKDIHQTKDTKDDTTPQKWICRFCGKEIGTKLSLSIHERIHTGVRPYVCECCGRSFKSKANLIQHQPVHTGIKRYKCSVCNKAFARKAFVTTHMRVHTGERPFKCEICGNRYTQIGDMRRHKKRHQLDETNLIVPASAKPTTISILSTRPVQVEENFTDGIKDQTPAIDSETGVIENNGLIKLHFAKDVTDFRRILVELQQ